MWFVTGQTRGDGYSCRGQSPEFLLVDLGISMASFYKHCHWQWHSDIRLMRVGSSCGSEAPLVLVSLFGNAGLCSKGFMLAINTAGTYQEIQSLCTGSVTPGKICYKIYWLAMIDCCIADSPENLFLLKRLSLWHIPQRWYYPRHIGMWTCLLFCVEEEHFFIVKEGLNHTCWWG